MRRRWPILVIALIASLLIWANIPSAALAAEANVDRVVVEKSARRLTLYHRGTPVKSYPIALGGNPVGHKQQEGDRRTPEGNYRIDRRNARSAFHLSLHISYPEPRDVAAATAQHVSPGSNIMIHGLRNGLGWLGKLHRLTDWTAGCIAVTNAEIEEIFSAVKDGTPIEITP